MIIQRIVFPEKNKEERKELYYHSNLPLEMLEDTVSVLAGTVVKFDTYFNLFLAKKWMKYTRITQFTIHVQIIGKGAVLLRGENQRIIERKEFHSHQILKLNCIKMREEYFFLEIEAKEACILKEAWIETDDPASEIHLALVICTYNRKEALKKNLAIIRQKNKVFVNHKQILDSVYVIDNAQNLSKEKLEDTLITVYKNPNTGGAGGFTRGMKEVIEGTAATHIILMDDDVEIEFETFLRNKTFLSYLKEEYQANFIGGAMLRMDQPYVMHAAGENWNNGHICNPYKNTDLRSLRHVIQTSSEIDPKQAYAGWWYCCIPRRHIEQHGYPIQFFLHCDDVEYSLRSGKPPIYMNGIAVWHEEFDDKKPSVLEYYDTRNRLIVNAIYKKNGKMKNALYIICERFYATVFRYRYKDFTLSVRAVQDFIKGPEWLERVDSERLHCSLTKCGYQMKEVKRLPGRQEHFVGSRLFLILRYLLPARGTAVLRMGAPVRAFAGKKRVLLVDVKNKKGFVAKKSWKKSITCLKKLLHSIWNLCHQYGEISKKWNNGEKAERKRQSYI